MKPSHILQECEVSSLLTEPTQTVQRSIAAFKLKFPKKAKTIVFEGLIKCLLTWHSFIGGQLHQIASLFFIELLN
jgi:hypothetical protein